MKRIFFWLLKRYSTTETERLEIIKVLDEGVSNTYHEQTIYGNVYNHFIEFVMGNPFINKLVQQNDTDGLKMIKKGIENSFDKAVQFIEEETKQNEF